MIGSNNSISNGIDDKVDHLFDGSTKIHSDGAAGMHPDSLARAEALDPTRSFCVSAPAGSGKTELLTQRVLALLPRVQRPEQVLAITFTRKAAAEMRERLVAKLEEAAAGISVQVAHEQKTRDLALAVLEHANTQGWSLDPEQFNLRTIDSLCNDLTRQMPILSAIGGEVEITDQHRPMFLQAVAELMALAGEDNLTGEALRALLLHFDNNWVRLRDLLVVLLERRGDWGGRLGMHHTPEESRAAMESVVSSLIKSVLTRARVSIIGDQNSNEDFEELKFLAQYSAQNLNLPEPVLDVAPERLADWKRVIAWLIKADNSDWYKSWRVQQGFPATGKTEKMRVAELVERLKSRNNSVFNVLLEIRFLPEMDASAKGWEFVLHLSHLLPILLAQLLLIFQRKGKVDFTHIALAAEDALGPDDEPTDLALRLDYHFEHILVDEFQDTSDQQMRLLKKLTRGWAEYNESGAAPRTLFIVGDGMQSIYGFRYANVALFLEARRSGVGDLPMVPLTLTRNFRSQQGVVDWVNRVFKAVLPEHDDPARGQVRHIWADATHPLLSGAAVETHLFSSVDDGQVDRSDVGDVSEAEFIADRIETIRCEEPKASIAVLVRARRHVRSLIAELRARRVSFVGRDLESLRDTPAVMDLLSLCRWLANPADEVAVLSLLRAPFCGLRLTDLHMLLADRPKPWPLRESLRKRLENTLYMPEGRGNRASSSGVWELSVDIRNRMQVVLDALDWAVEHRDRLSLPVWVEQVWLRLGGHRVLNTSGLRDAERFFALLRRAEHEGFGLNVEWLNLHLEQLFAEYEGMDHPVELMTVHKSKGLQFDYVFMPQLHKGVGSNERALLRWHLHLSDGNIDESGLIITADDQCQKNTPTLYNYLNWLQRQKDAGELRRLLYVGVTRARKRVWLTAESKLDEDTPDGLKVKIDGSPMGVLLTAVKEEVIFHPAIALKAALDSKVTTAGEKIELTVSPQLMRLKVPVLKDIEQVQSMTNCTSTVDNTRATPHQVGNFCDRVLGIALHRAFELLSLRECLPIHADGALESSVELSLRANGLFGSELSDVKNTVLAMINATLADRRGRWILSAREDSYSELPLVMLVGGEVKRKIIDRTFMMEGIRWVVDYKISRPVEKESLTAFLERQALRYREQLTDYCDLMRKFDGSVAASYTVKAALYLPALLTLNWQGATDAAWLEIK